MLSAYLDGELTQGDNQRVRLYLEQNPEAREAYDEMQQLQQLTAGIRFGDPAEEALDAMEQSLSVRAPRRFGWLLVIVGFAAWVVYALVLTLRNPRWPTLPELFTGAIIVGAVLLFLSVLRQRLLERPLDRYRRVRK
jgi:anti-sigma factor RsiW